MGDAASILVALLLTTTAVAQGSPEKVDSKRLPTLVNIPPDSLRQSRNGKGVDIEFEFGSLVVDETQTKIGHDFYDLFYSNWEPPEEVKSFTIVVTEKTLPRLGTQVTVRINDTEVFQNFIQPRYDTIEETARYAVDVVLDYLMNYEQIQRELQGNDMQGSGIF